MPPAQPEDVCDQTQSASILKLDAISCDDFFKLLSIEDLHSLSGTCKRMHLLTGTYFHDNYPELLCFMHNDGLYFNGIQLNRFAAFVRNVKINGYYLENCRIYSDKNVVDCFQFLRMNCPSLSRIDLIQLTLNEERIVCIKEILKQIKTLAICDCSTNGDLYEDLLRFCPKVKILTLKLWDFDSSLLDQKYPCLESAKFYCHNMTAVDHRHFFELNPTIRTFETNTNFFAFNVNSFLMSNITLDEFIISDYDGRSVHSIFHLLSQLHKSGFFRKLHISASKIDDSLNRHMDLCLSIWKIECGSFVENAKLPHLPNLRELVISDVTKTQSESLLEYFPNMEDLFVWRATVEEMLPLICKAQLLRTLVIVKVQDADRACANVIDVGALNKHRECLTGARKTTIYVNENVYLSTKWTMNDAHFERIELKNSNERRYSEYMKRRQNCSHSF